MQKNKWQELILANMNIDALNSMQQTAVETILKQPEILLLSPTGTGKTLAFLLPLLQMLKEDAGKVQCLVLAPSRELALQTEQVWKKMAVPFKVNCCYGGHSFETEVQNLSQPPALLIGTPGRIADHLRRETFDPSGIRILILDEFDKSLALGFQDEMSFIIAALNNLQKRILVSATDAVEIP
ncbi:MAG: DEAD/DEAH box helicase, partial [Panacibacter sp.]